MDAIQAEDFAAAKTILLEATADAPKDAQAAFYLGVAHDGLGELEAAQTQYRKALSLDPKLVEAARNLSTLLLDAKDGTGALEVIDAGIKQAPGDPILLMNRALALELSGDVEAALEAYAKAVEASPDNHELGYAYADVLSKANKSEPAIAELKRLRASDDLRILAASARLLGKLKQFSECVTTLDKAIKLKAVADLYVRRGVCRHDLKDDAGALADYEKALSLDPKLAAAHYYVGMHHRSQGNKKAAIESLTRAKDLGDGSLREAADRELKELKSK
jgi:Flp pilus assembly protein TadD